MTEWNHPELGVFEFVEYDWTKKIKLPAFEKFNYDSELNAKVNLCFNAETAEELPKVELVSIVLSVIKNQEELASKAITALWEDFTGAGRKSGMWWHSNLEEVTEDMDIPLDKAEDLYAHLNLSSVNASFYREEFPVVELSFDASFEIEHGVGVLTDGDKILGVGYTCSVSPWKE